MGIPLCPVKWCPSFRIIPSRYPPINLFEKVADPADLEAVYQIEAMTNDRLRDEVGAIELVPPEDRVSGPGTSPIMAAFTHIAPDGARFSTSTFGAYYCALDLETAVAETRFHRENFLRATSEPAQEVDMRVYAANVDAELRDIRGKQGELPDVYDPDDYAASQAFARKEREQGNDGIVYSSVRHAGGECAALFRPRLVSKCRQERHLAYCWDGEVITQVYEKVSLDIA